MAIQAITIVGKVSGSIPVIVMTMNNPIAMIKSKWFRYESETN